MVQNQDFPARWLALKIGKRFDIGSRFSGLATQRSSSLARQDHARQHVAAEAIEKASTENRVAIAMRHGMGAREAFETFGVL